MVATSRRQKLWYCLDEAVIAENQMKGAPGKALIQMFAKYLHAAVQLIFKYIFKSITVSSSDNVACHLNLRPIST